MKLSRDKYLEGHVTNFAVENFEWSRGKCVHLDEGVERGDFDGVVDEEDGLRGSCSASKGRGGEE